MRTLRARCAAGRLLLSRPQAPALALLLLGAGRAGVALLVRGLEPLVALVERHPAHARHPLAAEVADQARRARASRLVSGASGMAAKSNGLAGEAPPAPRRRASRAAPPARPCGAAPAPGSRPGSPRAARASARADPRSRSAGRAPGRAPRASARVEPPGALDVEAELGQHAAEPAADPRRLRAACPGGASGAASSFRLERPEQQAGRQLRVEEGGLLRERLAGLGHAEHVVRAERVQVERERAAPGCARRAPSGARTSGSPRRRRAPRRRRGRAGPRAPRGAARAPSARRRPASRRSRARPEPSSAAKAWRSASGARCSRQRGGDRVRRAHRDLAPLPAREPPPRLVARAAAPSSRSRWIGSSRLPGAKAFAK